ncbi:hypothetical protein FisN_8Lh176 [Fistulifera solaris]|uniref:HSF-type DNA-binding domain-containing protein n=1 Tax=Fistulifera solaris TaxID=1519565 RepID=A0A1Z5JDJ3_FISSO|nr:hypothetical protein FisN_8Lh176 [Fistulifera solaris]|eukprot:GAX12074.1 hypothetical protein FisN_8Lh176 [Fistulifera solaris]
MCRPPVIASSIRTRSTTDLASLSDIFALIDEATEELQQAVVTNKQSQPSISAEANLHRSNPRLVSSDDVRSAVFSSNKRGRHQRRRNSSSHRRKEYHEHGTVQHLYHDYSRVSPEAQDFFALPLKGAHGGTTIAFPVVLHRLLTDATEEGFEEIVAWQPHGRAFLVHDHHRFVDEVMPKYFRQTRFSSFQRQLSLYGFLRLTKGADSGAYYNEWFLRGLPHLCAHMQRTRVKGYGVRQSSSPETEPDFYGMDAVSAPQQGLHTGTIPSNSVGSTTFVPAPKLSIEDFPFESLELYPATIDNTFEEQEAMADFLSDVDLDDEDSYYSSQPYEGEDRFAKIYNHVIYAHPV